MVRLLTAVVLLFASPQSSAIVCEFWMGFGTQSDVDNHLGAIHPGDCDEIPGNMGIGPVVVAGELVPSDIADLRPVSYLKNIGFGGAGYGGGGYFKIFDNPLLVTLNGLEGIQGVGGDLVIRNNSSLSDCSALAALIGRAASLDTKEGVNGDVIIESNAEGCNSVAQVLASANKPVSTMPFYLLLTLTGLLALIGSIRARVPISSLVSGSGEGGS